MGETAEEPAAKKAKVEEEAKEAVDDDQPTGWESHTMNISEAVMKADEGKHFSALAEGDVQTLQGIGPKAAEVVAALKIKTVKELANYKFFLLARCIKTLAETETKKGRVKDSVMNIDKAVDKEYETKTLTELCDAPIGALEGLTDAAGELLAKLGVKSIGDLADLKYCRWAEAIVQAAKYENSMTKKERKVAAALKKLT